jgi:hypothetical protein
VEFAYVKTDGGKRTSYRPSLPVTFSYRGKRFPVGHALVDTGADITLLPREIAQVLELRLDDTEPLRIARAGGGDFVAYPSLGKVGYAIEKKGYRSICWEGTVYVAEEEPIVLLGFHECLEYFDLTFMGPEKKLSVLPMHGM